MTDETLTKPHEIQIVQADDGARVRDVDLGVRLGYARPEKIRQTIKRHTEEIQALGPLAQSGTMVGIGSGAEREVTEYHLNEEQAVLVCILSRAPRAKECRAEVVQVFTAYRRGQLAPAVEGTVIGGVAMETIIAAVAARLDRMIDDRLSRDPRAAGITSRSVREILDEAKVPSKGRRSLIRRACHSIKNYCLARGVVAHRCPRTNTWLWPEETIKAWLEESGRPMIADHMAKVTGQQVLPFRKPQEA